MLRWPVAVLWIAGIVVLIPLASGLAAVTNDTASTGPPSGAQSAQVAELQQEAQHAFGGPVSGRVISFPVMIADFEGERYLVSMLGENANWGSATSKQPVNQAVLRHTRTRP